MPTLILDNMPHPMYESLQRRAAADQRSVRDETMHLLRQVLDVGQDASPADAENEEMERPWRGVLVLPRTRETLFYRTLDIGENAIPKRSVAVNMAWHRTEPNDA